MKRIRAPKPKPERLTLQSSKEEIRDFEKPRKKKVKDVFDRGIPKPTPEEHLICSHYIAAAMEKRFGHKEWMDELAPLSSIGYEWKAPDKQGHRWIKPIEKGIKRVKTIHRVRS